MVETRGRRNIREIDGQSSPIGSPQSDDDISDDAEVDTKRKSRRNKKEDVESSDATKTRRSNIDSRPHVCKFCGKVFDLSQALGGHMNRHRHEKQEEEMRKAELLVAQKQQRQQQYMVGSSYNTMQGGGSGGGNLYYGTTSTGTPGPFHVPNPPAAILQLNQALAAQQNAHVSIHSSLRGYNPLDNTMTHYSQRNILSTGQYQEQHQGQAVQTKIAHPHGETIFQGVPSDTLHPDVLNMASYSHQARPNVSDHSFGKSGNLFVDKHGNPMQAGFQPGHDSHALPQDYIMSQSTSFQVQTLGSSATIITSDQTGGSSAHCQGVFEMDVGQSCIDQSTTHLVESGQADFGADMSLDDHTSSRLP